MRLWVAVGWLVFAVLVPFGASRPAAALEPTAPSAAVSRVGAALEAVLAAFGQPGGVLLVSGPGGREVAAAGYADLVQRRLVTPETRFHIASTGKMITATAVLRLIEEGRIALSSPILPLLDAPGAERLGAMDRLTVEHLLSHRSGLVDCLRNSGPSPAHPGLPWTALEVIAQAPCQGGGEPEVFDYCNTNFILLGRILETQGQGSLAEILTSRVLGPAGMAATTVGVDPADPTLAHGYRRPDRQGLRRDASLFAWSSPLGDAPITTTAADLDRFLSALLGPGGRLLQPATLRAMTTDRVLPGENDPGEGYGLGLEIETTGWGVKLGHSGRLAGFSAEAWYFPEQQTRIILLLNGDSPPDTDLLEPVLPRMFGPPNSQEP